MNIEEIKATLNYLLDNNLKLTEKGLDKLSINIEGPAGISKSSMVKQLAEERGAKYVKLTVSELEETGDLIGVPIKSYVMISPSDEEIYVNEKVVPQYINLGYKLCAECAPKMTYAIPSWVPEDPDQEVILLLDDFTRSNQIFMNAIMGLIQWGEYMSWKLPKKCHLILTSNPSGESYSTNIDLDPAQKS